MVESAVQQVHSGEKLTVVLPLVKTHRCHWCHTLYRCLFHTNRVTAAVRCFAPIRKSSSRNYWYTNQHVSWCKISLGPTKSGQSFVVQPVTVSIATPVDSAHSRNCRCCKWSQISVATRRTVILCLLLIKTPNLFNYVF